MNERRQLTAGIYGEEFISLEGPFGLSTGQMHSPRLAHNNGWYNDLGERLGWGDLSVEDISRIRDEINEGETFITIPENEAFYTFVEEIEKVGSMHTQRDRILAPGIGYVAINARFIISKGVVYEVGKEDHTFCDLDIKGITRRGALQLLVPSSSR